MALESETRGPFAVDEIPEDIVMTFLRPASKGGGPVNLTGFEAEMDLIKADNTLATRSEAQGVSISDPVEGVVRYTWVDGDFDQAGILKVQFHVFSGVPATTRLSSKVVELQVFEAPRHQVAA